MGKFVIAGGIAAVALLVYGIVDLIVTGDHRIKSLNRVLWAVIIVVVPILGPLAWLALGKVPLRHATQPLAPDDMQPKSATSAWLSDDESARRIREIEEQLQALDAEAASAAALETPEAEAEPTESADSEHVADDEGDQARA